MSNNSKLRTGVLQGKALWAHLDKPEVINGENKHMYSISVIPSEKGLKAFEQQCQEVWEEYSASSEVSGKRLRGEPSFGMKEDDEGTVSIKAKCKDAWHKKDGTVTPRVVPIFDGMGQVATKKLQGCIGNGSLINVSYELYPFVFSANSFGVSVRLKGVQVLKLVRFGGGEDAADLGFVKHEGAYNITDDIDDEEEDSSEEIPFTDGDEDDAVEEDF